MKRLLLLTVAILAMAACGKKGPPKPIKSALSQPLETATPLPCHRLSHLA